MTFSPEDRYKLDKWWLVQEIKYEFLATDPAETSIDFTLRDNGPSKAIQAKLLSQMASSKAIELLEQKGDQYRLGFTPGFVRTYNTLLIWASGFEKLREYEAQASSTRQPTDKVSVRLVKDGRNLGIVSDEDTLLVIRRLTSGLPPDLLLGFLINNRPNSTITLPELKRDIDGMASVKDLSEVIRGAGFDKQLKELFFRQSGAKTIELKNPIKITFAQWQEIESKLLSGKIVKNRKN